MKVNIISSSGLYYLSCGGGLVVIAFDEQTRCSAFKSMKVTKGKIFFITFKVVLTSQNFGHVLFIT